MNFKQGDKVRIVKPIGSVEADEMQRFPDFVYVVCWDYKFGAGYVVLGEPIDTCRVGGYPVIRAHPEALELA